MASAKDRLRSVLDRLDEYYGATSNVVKSQEPVDQIVFHLVSDGSGRDRSRRAFRRLLERFVDWNEARVSLANEIRQAIEPIGRVASDRAEHVHAFLDGLFARRHTMEMSFLAEVTPDEGVAFLVGFSGIDAGAAAMAVCLIHPEPVVLPSTAVIRVAQRSGVLAKGAAGEKARLALTKIVDPVDRLRLHRHLMRLGDEICRSRSYPCSRCPLAGICRTGRKLAPGAEPPAKMPPPPKQTVIRMPPEKIPIPTEEAPAQTPVAARIVPPGGAQTGSGAAADGKGSDGRKAAAATKVDPVARKSVESGRQSKARPTKPGAKVLPRAKARPKAKAKPKARAKPKPKAKARPKAKAKPKAKPKAKRGAKPGSRAQARKPAARKKAAKGKKSSGKTRSRGKTKTKR